MNRVQLGERLQSLPKPILYLILILTTSLPLFVDVVLPNEPVESSIDFYANIMKLQKGDKILIASDWTNSTRGESSGEFEGLLKILMRRGVKFAVYSTADPQAPQVARDSIRRVITSEKSNYEPFRDYVVLGFFPNSEGTNNAINNNVRIAFSGRKDSPPNSLPRDVFQSPFLSDVQDVADFKYLIVVTGTQTSTIIIERVKKTSLMMMVTGVMVPESSVYYASGQVKGLIGGIKGVFDLELMMDRGISPATAPAAKGVIKSAKYPDGVEGFQGKTNLGKGTKYIVALHFAIGLLILAVLVGNIGMFLSRRKGS